MYDKEILYSINDGLSYLTDISCGNIWIAYLSELIQIDP